MYLLAKKDGAWAGRGTRLCLALVIVALCTLIIGRPIQAQSTTVSEWPCAAPAANGPEAAATPYLALGSPFVTVQPARIDHTVLYGATNRYGLLHTGFDMPAKLSTPVYAATSGRVIHAGPDTAVLYSPRANYYGKMIVLQMDAPGNAMGATYVIYGHLDRVVVSRGQQVQRGDHIGYVGMTGIAVGPHLHLEVRYPTAKFTDTRNPALWLTPAPGTGVIAGSLRDASGRPVPADRILIYRLGARQVLWRTVKTYQGGPGIGSDARWQENFSAPDAAAGKYRIVAGRGASTVQADVTVPPGGMAFVALQTGNTAARATPAVQTCTWSPASPRAESILVQPGGASLP